MKEVIDFLNEAQTFYIATMDGDQPRVRPFGVVNEFDGKLYIITGNKKKVFSQLMANPKVEISATVGGRWIRLECEMVRDDRREAKTSMLEAAPNLRSMYSEDDGVMEVLYMKNATATFYSFTEAPHTVTF